MPKSPRNPSFAEYRTVGEAAQFLGVSAATLRNWDRTGKLKPRRHPQNGYRIYLHADLERVLRSADAPPVPPGAAGAALAPKGAAEAAPAPPSADGSQIDWRGLGETDHFVQFYEDDDFLIECIAGYTREALVTGGSSVQIMTAAHRKSLITRLSAVGLDLAELLRTDRLVMLDARETLDLILVNDVPDRAQFAEIVGSVIARGKKFGGRVHAFGEMVALLWENGNPDGAIKLEQLWSELAQSEHFVLFCAYPLSGFKSHSAAQVFQGICGCHTRVIPAESYSALATPDERMRAISLLQLKAHSLEAEIAHRTVVEQALLNREMELSDICDNATEGLNKVASDGEILWANKADYTLLGYSAHEYIGQPIHRFHADADAATEILRLLNSGLNLENYQATLRCKDGTFKHVLMNSSACTKGGEFLFARCYTRDITRRWEAERALSDADRRKDELLTILTRELRNPLAPLKNGLEIMRVTGSVESSQALLERQLAQLTRVADELLDIERMTRGALDLHFESVDLSDVLNSSVEQIRPLLTEGGQQLLMRLPSAPIPVSGDRLRLGQVFSNLLRNSVQCTDPGGRIEIAATLDRKNVIVSVRDDGLGIACHELAYVFDMFHQLDRSPERTQAGLGIGLTLARRVVEQHGGTINALSEGLGQGSEFIVHLPLIERASRTLAAPSECVRHRILIAEDNRDSGDTLKILLELKGHEARVVRNGEEALKVAAEYHPEVILMDLGMPKLDGHEAARLIRQLPGGPQMVIIALTGRGLPADYVRTRESGFNAHLLKPVDLEALERILASCCAP